MRGPFPPAIAAMTELAIRAPHAGLPPEITEAIRQELLERGIVDGTLYIGEAWGHLEVLSLMFLVGSQPVLAGVPKATFSDVQSARAVAANFAAKIIEKFTEMKDQARAQPSREWRSP